MNYELAKKLKDAGFPQEPAMEMPNSLEEVIGDFYWMFPTEGGCGGLAWLHKDEYERAITREGWTTVKGPTFEELVVAIGKDFESLCVSISGMEYGFAAMNSVRKKDDQLVARGKTPTETIANLWLAIKKYTPS